MTAADPEKHPHRALSFAAVAVALLILYVLSLPPMELMAVEHDWNSLIWFNRWFYAPLYHLLKNHPALGVYYAHYYGWWLHIFPFTVPITLAPP